MPLTACQASVVAVMAPTRSDVSYLVGGAALHMGPSGERFSNAFDFFDDAADAANQTVAADALALRAVGYEVTVICELRGFVSAAASRNDEATVLDRAHESAWRFLPLVGMTGRG